MSNSQSHVWPRLLAIFFIIVSFLFPSVHFASASEMEIEHGDMNMNCESGDCEGTSSQQDCLEHCLQASTPNNASFIVTRSQNDTQSGIVHHDIFEKPTRKAAKTHSQTTGPPGQIEKHLTTQKRE